MMKKIALNILVLVMMMPSVRAMAEGFGVDMSLKTRAGYSIGASSPYGMPAAIVGIEAFRMTPSFRVGVDVAKPVDTQWAVSMGFFVENKTMDVSVRTKGYHMEMRRGAEGLEGVFTGHVSQQISMLVLTLPVCATFSVSTEVNLRAGVYGSLLMNGKFSGTASDAIENVNKCCGLHVFADKSFRHYIESLVRTFILQMLHNAVFSSDNEFLFIRAFCIVHYSRC